MFLNKPQDLFKLSTGDIVTKRNLYDLIQYSKVASSEFWAGNNFLIGNTPQQGINWVGQLPSLKAVIIKTRPGSYENDAWLDEDKAVYQYSFKARESKISYEEKANKSLILQPQYQYPILLFTECSEGWEFEGVFSVTGIEDKYVVLGRGEASLGRANSSQEEDQFQEGSRRYVTHLMAERNQNVVQILKEVHTWLCDICGLDFNSRYGIPYIEAHHKTPISTYSSSHSVKIEDFALLCPNCHRAVHAYMKEEEREYDEIKELLLRIA